MEKRLVHIYYGDGKGKTSAAIGLGVRAAGSGLRVYMTRFLKSSDSGELNILKNVENFTLGDSPAILPFYFQMTEKQKQQYKSYTVALFAAAKEIAMNQKADVIIFDELLDAVALDIIGEKAVLDFLSARPQNTEIVITGHTASKNLIASADYVSKITAEKHPFDSGMQARKGIEY